MFAIAEYYPARGKCTRAIEFRETVTDDDRHDEGTRFIVAAFLNDCPCRRCSGSRYCPLPTSFHRSTIDDDRTNGELSCFVTPLLVRGLC